MAKTAEKQIYKVKPEYFDKEIYFAYIDGKTIVIFPHSRHIGGNMHGMISESGFCLKLDGYMNIDDMRVRQEVYLKADKSKQHFEDLTFPQVYQLARAGIIKLTKEQQAEYRKSVNLLVVDEDE